MNAIRIDLNHLARALGIDPKDDPVEASVDRKGILTIRRVKPA